MQMDLSQDLVWVVWLGLLGLVILIMAFVYKPFYKFQKPGYTTMIAAWIFLLFGIVLGIFIFPYIGLENLLRFDFSADWNIGVFFAVIAGFTAMFAGLSFIFVYRGGA